jgi:hypothetical protein
MDRIIDLVLQFWDKIWILIKYIVKRKVIVIPLGVVFAIIATYCGYTFFNLSTQYNRIFAGLLKTNSEPTPQKFKGVESFILSVVDSKSQLPSSINDLENSLFTKDFISCMEALKDSAIAFSQNRRLGNEDLDLHLIEGEEVLTEDPRLTKDYGFLFLPIHLLNSSIPKSEISSVKRSDRTRGKAIIDKWFEKENGLIKDIVFTKAISPVLQKINRTSIFQSTVWRNNFEHVPRQVYFITKNGINRIFNYNERDLYSFYKEHFTPRTFFPGRPYFWSTIDNKKVSKDIDEIVPEETDNVSGYFNITRPYLDLGWNGFVITLSRGIEIDGQVMGVLCIDLPLNISILEALKDVESKTEGITTEQIDFTYDFHQTAISPRNLDDGSPIKDLWPAFHNYVMKNANKRAELLGNIQVFNDEKRLNEYTANDELVAVFLPLGDPQLVDQKTDNPPYKVRGLFMSIDLKTLRSNLNMYAIGAVLSIILLFGIFTGLYVNTQVIKREYEKAFKKVDEVMDRISIPYARLNSEDMIIDFNPAFCKAVGYDPLNDDEIKKLKARTFKSLCSNFDQEQAYDRIQQKRKNKEKVDPYPMLLMAKTGSVLQVIVVSADFPSAEVGKLPDTFGLLLNAGNKDEIAFVRYPNHT